MEHGFQGGKVEPTDPFEGRPGSPEYHGSLMARVTLEASSGAPGGLLPVSSGLVGRGKGTSLISSVRERKEPREHARKRLMQAAEGLSKCYSVMSLFAPPTPPFGKPQPKSSSEPGRPGRR